MKIFFASLCFVAAFFVFVATAILSDNIEAPTGKGPSWYGYILPGALVAGGIAILL